VRLRKKGLLGLAALCVSIVIVAVSLAARHSGKAPTRLIVLSDSIGGIVLGQRPASVEIEAGHPASRARLSGAGRLIETWRYRDVVAVFLAVRVPYNSQLRVVRVSTTSARFRTADGLGVGSNLRRLRGHVAGLRCYNAGQDCAVGFEHGAPGTEFRLPSGVVTSIAVARQP
jgi:hypothetical protein